MYPLDVSRRSRIFVGHLHKEGCRSACHEHQQDRHECFLYFPCEHQQEGFYCIQDVSALHTFLRAMPPHTSFSIRVAPESIQFKCKHHTFTHPLQVASTNFSAPTEFKQVFECEVLQLAAALSATTNRVTLQRCKGSSLNPTKHIRFRNPMRKRQVQRRLCV